MKQMRVRSAEGTNTIDAKRVVPDHPTTTGETALLLCQEFQFGSVLVANSQPKCTRRLQDFGNTPHPLSGPVEILLPGSLVVVHIVVVTDVERRIRKHKI